MCFKMILRGVFFCILKSTSHSTNVCVMDNCLTALLQDFAIHLMPKRSWLAVQIACHPFYTPLSAQHRYQSLVDRHQTVPQGTWILPVAQPPADTDPEQVFHPYFVLFIHAGSSWSLPEKKKKKTKNDLERLQGKEQREMQMPETSALILLSQVHHEYFRQSSFVYVLFQAYSCPG